MNQIIQSILIGIVVGITIILSNRSYGATDAHTSECMKCHDMSQYNDPNNTSMLKTTNIFALCGECHTNVTHSRDNTPFITCIQCHNHHDIKLLEREVICLTCHELERQGKHKEGAKCDKCHEHSNGFLKK